MWRKLTLAALAVLALVAAVGAIVYFVTRENDEADASGCRVYLGMPSPTPRTPETLSNVEGHVEFDIVLPAYVPDGVEILDVSAGPPCRWPSDHVDVVYEGGGYRFGMDESLVDYLRYEEQAGGEQIAVSGAPARLFLLDREPHDLLMVAWSDSKLHYVASTYLTEKMTRELFLQILESMPED